MAQDSLPTHRTRTINDAALALSLARDGALDCASKLSDVVGLELMISRSEELGRKAEELISQLQGAELLHQVEVESQRREAHAAEAEYRREDERLRKLDDSLSDYADVRDDV